MSAPDRLTSDSWLVPKLLVAVTFSDHEISLTQACDRCILQSCECNLTILVTLHGGRRPITISMICQIGAIGFLKHD